MADIPKIIKGHNETTRNVMARVTKVHWNKNGIDASNDPLDESPPFVPDVFTLVRTLPHMPEPARTSEGTRMTGTPPLVYSTSMYPLAPTAHWTQVRMLENGQRHDEST